MKNYRQRTCKFLLVPLLVVPFVIGVGVYGHNKYDVGKDVQHNTERQDTNALIANDKFSIGQTIYFDKRNSEFVLPSEYSISRFGDDVNWDPFDAVYSIKTPCRQHVVYLTVLNTDTQENDSELIPLIIRDMVSFDRDLFINHSCMTDNDYFIGIFENQILIGLYQKDFANHKFILADSVKCVRCCPNPETEDYYYPERYEKYVLQKKIQRRRFKPS